MRKLFCLTVILSSLAFAGQMVDSEGNSYPTVKIGEQVWMAKNMNANVGGSFCYDNSPEKCKKVGRLYTRKAAKNVCPDGWRLPDVIDYNILLSNMGENREQRGDMLRHKTWKRSSNKSGFSAEPGGMRLDGQYAAWGKSASFWAYGTMGDYTQLNVTEDGAFVGNIVESEFDGFLDDEDDREVTERDEAYAVRCIQAAVGNRKYAPEDYPSVTIGNQVWMARNLDEDVVGSYIPTGGDNNNLHGRLYTWNAAVQACPEGWRLPQKKDYEILLSNLPDDGSERVNILTSQDYGGLDPLGFGAVPDPLHESTHYWTSFSPDIRFATEFNLAGFDMYSKKLLHYVRCIKGNVNLVAFLNRSYEKHGKELIVDERDGQLYMTTLIGSLRWMSENLNYETESSHILGGIREGYDRTERVYTAEDAAGACPASWRLPTEEEWNDLLKEMKDRNLDSRYALENSSLSPEEGLGFVGYVGKVLYSNGSIGKGTRYWTTGTDGNVDVFFDFEKQALKKNIYNGASYSVRCVRVDEAALEDKRDGKKYKTVQIGEQVWMAENLNFKINDDDCHKIYGCYYTRNDLEKACPEGWRPPKKQDFEILVQTIKKILNRQRGTGFVPEREIAQALIESKEFGFFLKKGGYWNTYFYEGDENAYLLGFTDDFREQEYHLRVSRNFVDIEPHRDGRAPTRCIKK